MHTSLLSKLVLILDTRCDGPILLLISIETCLYLIFLKGYRIFSPDTLQNIHVRSWINDLYNDKFSVKYIRFFQIVSYRTNNFTCLN